MDSSSDRKAPLRSLCFIQMLKTTIYVDGLNLYYGCVKNSQYKWLDLKSLFSTLLQNHNQITNIKYFTAMVKPTPDNEEAPLKQKTYIRALESYIPEISVHYGHFLRNTVSMAMEKPPHQKVKVLKTEEKGSDVNLAVHLLNDAWLGLYDCAVIVSNDSDMAESMKLTKENFPDKVLGLITPGQNTRTSEQLKKNASFVRKIRQSILKKSQLPYKIPGTNITKPDDWR